MKAILVLLVVLALGSSTHLSAQDSAAHQPSDTVYATFKGGDEAWRAYMSRSLRTDAIIRKGAKAGLYIINVRFKIEADGSITEVVAENDRGFGTAEEAVRVIKKSPRWKPATVNGQPVADTRRQPVVFQLVNDPAS